jgi:hypothetical protein
LLPDDIIEPKAFAFIIADLGLSIRNGHFIAPGIRSLRTIQQVEFAVYILG